MTKLRLLRKKLPAVKLDPAIKRRIFESDYMGEPNEPYLEFVNNHRANTMYSQLDTDYELKIPNISSAKNFTIGRWMRFMMYLGVLIIVLTIWEPQVLFSGNLIAQILNIFLVLVLSATTLLGAIGLFFILFEEKMYQFWLKSENNNLTVRYNQFTFNSPIWFELDIGSFVHLRYVDLNGDILKRRLWKEAEYLILRQDRNDYWFLIPKNNPEDHKFFHYFEQLNIFFEKNGFLVS